MPWVGEFQRTESTQRPPRRRWWWEVDSSNPKRHSNESAYSEKQEKASPDWNPVPPTSPPPLSISIADPCLQKKKDPLARMSDFVEMVGFTRRFNCPDGDVHIPPEVPGLRAP